ncbi:MAG: pyruvate carboxyltransferase [Puniceicoccaceae bacterium]|nr:MAG: pyruvate carboxyltransferase [Puniceicoccaceae bacterium]
MAQTPLKFGNTVLRDGHQSLAATRMTTAQMLPALEDLDALGFSCLETWGGATIDAGLRFLKEFPFDRLDALRKGTPKTPHMMLLRGQNIVQYSNFPDDVVEAFVACAARHGMDIFRIFDALNDLRNIETAVRAAKHAGKHAQGVLCYTSSPFHTVEKFIELGVEIERMGCDSICIKDMAGLIPPYKAALMVRGIKQRVKIPVVLHTHETAGLGAPTYYAGIEAGVDEIDVSISPFANGTGQPDTVRMLALLEDHPRCPQFDRARLARLGEHFAGVYRELHAFTNPANERVDTEALAFQVPGGMLSNFRNQLKEQRMEDRFDDVFREIPYVRQCLGWIPLVTPTSQIVGVQAILNVKFGRWKNFSPQATDLALGLYGRTPAPVDPEVRAIAARKSGKDPVECRPADLLKPRMADLRKELTAKGLPADDEHCVIYAMFPRELEDYLTAKQRAGETPPADDNGREANPAPRAAAPSPAVAQPAPGGREAPRSPGAVFQPDVPRRFAITVDGQRHEVTLEDID